MTVAIVIALAAVALGAGLGLAPGARRTLIGPLRTLALAAVVSVILLHLLPEALGGLGALGLLVFGAGLALPRWLSWLLRSKDDGHGHALGLELGFAGLVVHHVGDGLALGAYAHVGEHSGHSHLDVLLALALHTIPLVAVVAASYTRLSGVASAMARSASLAVASLAGIFLSELAGAERIEQAHAWIAAAVAGVLLHAILHDIGEDLPTDTPSRVLDFVAAILGGALWWIFAEIGSHGAVAAPLGESFAKLLRVTAPALVVGLVLGALLDGARFAPSRLRAPDGGAARSPVVVEASLLYLSCFGFLFALVRDAAALALSVVRGRAPGASAPLGGSFLARLDRRLETIAIWALIGMLIALALDSALPARALAGAPPWLAGGAIVLACVSLPITAPLAPTLGFVLAEKGLAASWVLLLAILGPLAIGLAGRARLIVPVLAVALALAVGPFLDPGPLAVSSTLAAGSLALVVLGVLRRVYVRGLRGVLLVAPPRR